MSSRAECPRLKSTKGRLEQSLWSPPGARNPAQGAWLSSAQPAIPLAWPWHRGCREARAGQGSGDLASAAPFLTSASSPTPAQSERPDPSRGQSRLRSSCTRSACPLPRPAHAEVSRWRIKLIPILHPGAGTQISSHPGRVGTELQVRPSGIQALRRRGMAGELSGTFLWPSVPEQIQRGALRRS